MAKKSKAHPGFKAVASSIAKKQGVSKAAANRILGAATAKNPTLKKRAAANRKKSSKKK